MLEYDGNGNRTKKCPNKVKWKGKGVWARFGAPTTSNHCDKHKKFIEENGAPPKIMSYNTFSPTFKRIDN